VAHTGCCLVITIRVKGPSFTSKMILYTVLMPMFSAGVASKVKLPDTALMMR